MHELTKLALLELHSLAQSINNREPTIQALRGKTEEMASQAVAEAVLQGQELLAARAKVPKGQWLLWLAANCPNLKREAAYRYMSLSINITRVTNCNSLRSALALCDRDPNIKPQPNVERSTLPYVQTIYLFSRATKYLRRHPLDASTPTEGLDKLRSELEPTARTLWPDRFPPTVETNA